MPIKILEPQVVARIAAGEIIERPASVVKELVENSLDAAATQISVEVNGGGVGLIRVTDNGLGIPAAELELAFERYATSKIGGLDDLESISSLGFRGEALPSIAAVSHIEVVTCAGSQAGNFLSLREGVRDELRSQGRAKGTTITVKNLLRNVPARLKFLKSVPTENSHIANVVSQYALARPEVKFSLITDGRPTLRTPGSGRLLDSIIEVYGAETAREMLDIDSSESIWQGSPAPPQVRVTGMVGSPALNRSNRDYLSFFVNRRWINSKLLAWAVEEAYHGLLMQGRHPVAVINISVPPGEVDVNIHPTKTEVKFQNERLVFSAVQKAVRRALVAQAPVPGIEEVSAAYGAPPLPHPGAVTPFSGQARQTFWMPRETGRQETISSPTLQPTPSSSLPALRLLGQLAGSYIVAEGPEGLYLIDQHAAHERILFERIRTQIARHKLEVQGLLEPATFEVTPRQDESLKACYRELAESGFSIEPFGERSYLVRAVPLPLNKKDWAAALRELLEAMSEGLVPSKAEGGDTDWREKVAISFACHGAIKAGQTLADSEMREMLRQLEETSTPNSCPHGRPTMIRLSLSQMEKEFHRA
ncbi:MAG: DNA mismatch repair endonuclease MutL [Chloroflexi bacterium]|nr:DNA mismatch repair endonuclease MutL [Chloroflexota bacterium]